MNSNSTATRPQSSMGDSSIKSLKSSRADPGRGTSSRLGMSDAKSSISNGEDIKKPSFGLKRPTTAIGSQSSQPESRKAPGIATMAKATMALGGLKRPTNV